MAFCKKCEIKIDELNSCKSRKLICKSCYNETKKTRDTIYRELNREKLNEKSKLYRESNKETISLKQKQYNKENGKLNHEKLSNKKFGMNEERIKKIEELWLIKSPASTLPVLGSLAGRATPERRRGLRRVVKQWRASTSMVTKEMEQSKKWNQTGRISEVNW